MAKAPAKKSSGTPRSKAADKANRPSPPDRDGDGNSGGSLPGNETVEQAKGSAEHALAAAQIADDGTATIIIKGVTTGKGASHPLGVNGRIRHVATNVKVQVSADELAAVEASHVEYEVVVPLAQAAEAAGVEGSSSAAEPSAPEDSTAPAEGETEPEGGQTEGAENADPAAVTTSEGSAQS